MMQERYTILRDEYLTSLIQRVNALAGIPVTDEGWRTTDRQKYRLVSVVREQQEGYVAILETL